MACLSTSCDSAGKAREWRRSTSTWKPPARGLTTSLIRASRSPASSAQQEAVEADPVPVWRLLDAMHGFVSLGCLRPPRLRSLPGRGVLEMEGEGLTSIESIVISSVTWVPGTGPAGDTKGPLTLFSNAR